jgi:hypothetical protein
MGLAATSACGRAPLDDQVADVSADSGLAGSGGGGARVPTEHRVSAAACPVFDRSGANNCQFSQPGPSVPGFCNVDADCFAKPNGRCEVTGFSGGCGCVYDACTSDGDCAGGTLCACNPVGIGNRCVTGSCRIDSDCGVGGYCGPVVYACSPQIFAYQCHSSTDGCLVDGDCPINETCEGYSEKGWACWLPQPCRG